MEDEEGGLEGEFSGWREGAVLIEREMRGRGDPATAGVGGDGGEGVGLSSTPRASLDFFGSARGTGIVTATMDPFSDDPSSTTNNSSAAAAQSSYASQHRPSTTRPSHHYRDTEAEDQQSNFFEDFAHRVKNTFESADRPGWMRGFTEGLTRPKWMGGDEDGEGLGGGRSGGNGNGGNGGGGALGGLFGRAREGRVRLG